MEVRVSNLSFRYPGGRRDILRDVSLSFPTGKFTALIGPNGSGKTTLLKQLNRILSPQSGTVYFGGEDIAALTPSDLAKQAAYVPQMSGSALPGTVLDTVLLGRRPYIQWRLSDADIEIATDTLMRLRIDDLAQRDFTALSGGQKQTVLIARALAQTPEVYLFDEPVSFLDVRNQLEIMTIARDLARKDKKTVIAVIHDLNLAMRFADHIVMMKDGVIHASGTPSEVITEQNIWDVYSAHAQIFENRFVVTSL